MVIMAASKGQQALDRLSDRDPVPNGLFTREFLPMISTPGLSVTDALKRVRSSVASKAKAVGHEQNPALYDQTDGDFYFVAGVQTGPASPSGGAVTEVIQRVDPAVVELSVWDSIKTSENPDDFRAYLAKYPSGQFSELAQTRIRRLSGNGDGQPSAAPATLAARKASRKDCPDCPEMVDIPAGEFQMGAGRNEAGSGDHEKPRHSVRIAKAFAASKYEITVKQFAAFVNASGHKAEGSCHVWVGSEWENMPGKSWRDPGFSQDESHPVVCVSWNDAQAYAAWLSRASGKHYRLPSESEWEYMARAGTRTSRFWGDDPALACEYANVHDETTQRARRFAWEAHECQDGFVETAPVGRFKPNAFGLHDTAGNAWEWVADCLNSNYINAPADGSARVTDDCNRRVYRGGGWSGPSSVRSAARTGNPPGYRSQLLGFRVVRAAD
jgi:formylglycine-generating enzyme required for sulfatase activity